MMLKRKGNDESKKAPFYFLGCILFGGLLLFGDGAVQAKATTDPDTISRATEEDASLAMWNDESFVYRREGRPDPFAPFIETFIQNVPQEELTGMRRFEPGQLTLVSIVLSESDALAMVQDSVGKGYIVREGTKIGRYGVVTEIIPNQVLIEQKMPTTFGENRYKTVEMVLRKEEGERK